jgi:hypothetical protein
MLSKVEMGFFFFFEKFGICRRVLRHRVKDKSVQMREHVLLL